MSAAEALPLLQQMADALDAAHRSGVIHRDFKTSNVMLVPSGEGVRAVVTDFGLARGIRTGSESTATLTNHVAGTLDYMAPELLTGSVASFRSDIYALGVVAYKMVTGLSPPPGATPGRRPCTRWQARQRDRSLPPGCRRHREHISIDLPKEYTVEDGKTAGVDLVPSAKNLQAASITVVDDAQTKTYNFTCGVAKATCLTIGDYCPSGCPAKD